MDTTRRRRRIGTGAALAGAVAAGLLVIPLGASAAPQLPPVSPEELVASVATATPPALEGTVEVDNDLGLPAVPGVPALGNGSSTIRVWSGGDGRARVALPDGEGEKTLVSDGTTRWSYDSADREVTRAPGAAGPGSRPDLEGDPTAAATDALARLRPTSTVAVEGTEEVAGRPAYTLVLSPLPTERTLLRQVRVAVDAETRIPLQLTVLAQGSGDPALQVGFTDLEVGPQDPSLFTFTPPPGATVTDAPARTGRPDGAGPPEGLTTSGDGWDTVVVGRLPAGGPGSPTPDAPAVPGDTEAVPGDTDTDPDDTDAAPGRPGPGALAALGTPVSGPWGSGRVITTAVATAIVTDDGRVAAGAVPEQVLTEALAR